MFNGVWVCVFVVMFTDVRLCSCSKVWACGVKTERQTKQDTEREERSDRDIRVKGRMYVYMCT